MNKKLFFGVMSFAFFGYAFTDCMFVRRYNVQDVKNLLKASKKINIKKSNRVNAFNKDFVNTKLGLCFRYDNIFAASDIKTVEHYFSESIRSFFEKYKTSQRISRNVIRDQRESVMNLYDSPAYRSRE